jgi:hypothetical protein
MTGSFSILPAFFVQAVQASTLMTRTVIGRGMGKSPCTVPERARRYQQN